MTIIDGKKLSNEIIDSLTNECIELKKIGITPGLAVVLVGNNPASATYVSMKEKACKRVGINSFKYHLNEDSTQKELIDLIDRLNKDDKVNGILVQLPLPNHFNTDEVLEFISYKKDVDGFHPYIVGLLSLGLEGFKPCTPYGVMKLLKAYEINPEGMNACVIGRSNIVGKPMSMLLLNSGATVTTCHSKTKNLKEITLQSDLIVVGVGKPNLLTADMVKDGAVVIDVGINRIESGKLVGDADFDGVSKKASFITPVPGGVGPMTIAMLLSNCVEGAKK